MSALAEHESRRARLWGRVPARHVPPIPEQATEKRTKALFAGHEGDVSPTVPFNFLKVPGPRAIVKLVSLRHEVGVRDILGNSRTPRLVAARHEAMWLVHTHCPRLSMPDMGRIFGRDHTTILHALSKFTGERRRADG